MATHPIVQLIVAEDFDAVSFMNRENLIQLGDTLVLITSILQKFYHTLGQVKVSINPDPQPPRSVRSSTSTRPVSSTISYLLTSQFLELIFDYASQRLIEIKLTNLSHLILSYRSKFFSHPRQSLAPTLKEIDSVFGSTKPGKLATDTKTYVLDYDRKTSSAEHSHLLRLKFREASKVHSQLLCSELSMVSTTTEKETHNQNETYTIPLSSLLSTRCSLLLDKLVISKSASSNSYLLKFHLLTKSSQNPTQNSNLTRAISFHDKIQNVESELGSPDEIFYKSEHEHSHVTNSQQESCTDFYYNYYSFGLDILFSGQSKTVKKVILHTCSHEHEEFARRYSPCNFEFSYQEVTSASKFSDPELKNLLAHGDENKNLMLLSRNNQVPECAADKSLVAITGSSKSSGFLYHSAAHSEIFEFTGSGQLALVTLY